MTKSKICIAIIEDIDDIRDGLQEIVNSSEEFLCEHCFSSSEEALEHLPIEKADIVLVDINLPGGLSGIECVRELKSRRAELQLVMCTVFEDNENIFESLKAGASGYLLKKTPSAQFIQSLRDVYAGGSPMNSQIARKVVQFFQEKSPKQKAKALNLSIRETDILDQLEKGFRYKEIAANLFISMDTVRTHVRNIYEKLQVTSRTEAIRKVYRS